MFAHLQTYPPDVVWSFAAAQHPALFAPIDLLRLTLNFLHSPHLPICEANLDAVWVIRRFSQNIFDDTFGKLACALVLL